MSSHGCSKDEIVYNPIGKLFTHYPQWVRSKQFRQEVTFCVVKMVLSSVYRKFSSEDCLFYGYTPGYVTKSVGLSEIYLLPLSYTDAFLLSSRVPTSALQSTQDG